jgi:hypothetical protein
VKERGKKRRKQQAKTTAKGIHGIFDAPRSERFRKRLARKIKYGGERLEIDGATESWPQHTAVALN